MSKYFPSVSIQKLIPIILYLRNMNSTATTTEIISTNVVTYYHIIIPLSLTFIFLAMIFACISLILIICIPRLHTLAYLLVSNGAIASIFYCIVQSVNYSYLAFLPWETSDRSCRWRGFFSYMTVVAVIYSYLAQAISRLLIIIFSSKYHWATSFKTHRVVLLIKWTLVICLPLPALVTDDIYFRPISLCWVPKEYTLHLAYIVIVYYFIPTLFIIAIYIFIYCRVKRRKNRVSIMSRKNRDVEVLSNMMILFSIYIFGALPTLIYVIGRIEVFYAIGLISMSMAIAVENIVALFIDGDLRRTMKNYIHRSINRIAPVSALNR